MGLCHYHQINMINMVAEAIMVVEEDLMVVAKEDIMDTPTNGRFSN